MFSNHEKTNRSLALFTFFASLILYILTMAPTASFWDAGEFIAVAHGLEVNHPPGAPFYSLLGRLFSMFMPASYVAVSINFISALSSALTVMLLYLIIVRLVREWKGAPEKMPGIEQIGMYGGAIIGALTFAVTDTFWFNAVEAEVYAVSMFFTAMVVWLALVWAEKHDTPNNERWLLLIAYLFGIALGIHLLNLLALFFVALIIYFKKKEFQLISLAVAGFLASISFLVIYPFTVQTLPSIMEGMTQASYGLIGPIFFMAIVICLVVSAIYLTHKNNYRMANIIAISYALILIGYSSYALIFIRSAADPPIDENDPETVESFISYLEREQYGDTPLLTGNTYDSEQGRINREQEAFFPRRYSTNPRHMQQYRQYSSDLDFFLNYQVSHMYIRYFNWNFIGRDSDIQDAGWQAGFTETKQEDNTAHNSYFYIPFLLGLFGMLFHFQNDWKRALSVLVLFIMTGLAIIVFLNQTPLQPRERDYAYVGSFFAFAIWIGMGSIGILELIREHLTSSKFASYAAIGLLFCASPLVMGVQNFDDHDRSERYVAPDYAHNLLQSTAPNSIIFTNGDNDTFPLWYLQEVEGVRTDVRIVNLSLLNTDWYIKQMRDQWAHESPPLPISFSDDDIEEMTSNLPLHQPDTMSIPVNKDLLKQAFSDSNQYRETIGVKPDTSVNVYSKGIDFGIPVDSLDSEVSWYFKGRSAGRDRQGNQRYFLQVQDQVILNILQNNKWMRPVYFANTVSNQSQLGLQPYFRFEGKAFRIVPQRHKDARYGWLDPATHAKRLEKFRFREWNNPDTYFDENIRRMLGNYRFSITELANKYKEVGKADSASYWLKWGEERVPFKISSDNINSIALYAYSYASLGDDSSAVELAEKAQQQLIENLEWNMKKFNTLQQQLMTIDQDLKSARENANISERQELQSQRQQIGAQRKQLIQRLSYAINHYTIVQRIYYMAGLDEKANSLADLVNSITSGQLPIPTTKEENKSRFDQLQLD